MIYPVFLCLSNLTRVRRTSPASKRCTIGRRELSQHTARGLDLRAACINTVQQASNTVVHVCDNTWIINIYLCIRPWQSRMIDPFCCTQRSTKFNMSAVIQDGAMRLSACLAEESLLSSNNIGHPHQHPHAHVYSSTPKEPTSGRNGEGG